MFGPIDTSYQLLNHSAGTPQPMESSYRPPVSHAGSPGPRAISSSKVPGGSSSDDSSSAYGRCRICEGQSTSGFSAPRSLYIATPARLSPLRSRGICPRRGLSTPSLHPAHSVRGPPPVQKLPSPPNGPHTPPPAPASPPTIPPLPGGSQPPTP